MPVSARGGGVQDAGADGPDDAAVRAHLKHVLASPDFASAPQLQAFLTYIVERKLEGAADRLKAYSIATEALGRSADFDAQSDPIVRVQARRLRQALQAYYAHPSADDSIRITLPVGGYVPDIQSFALHEQGPPETAPAPPPAKADRGWAAWQKWATLAAAVAALLVALWQELPRLVVSWEELTWRQPPAEGNPLAIPPLVVTVDAMRQMPDWFTPEAFRRSLELALSRFDEFVVLVPLSSEAIPPDAYRLSIEFAGDEMGTTVNCTARLTRGARGDIAWSSRFALSETAVTSYETLPEVEAMASALGQPYGVLYSQLLGDPRKTAAQACLLRGYEWFQRPATQEIEPIRACLEDLLRASPGNHIAHILLGYVYVERYRHQLGTDPGGDLDKALIMARRAIALRPDSAGSYQVLMEVQAARGDEEGALAAGQYAVKLNPNDSDVLADYGCRLIFRGRYAEGEAFAGKAAALNQVRPPWHEFCLFVAANNTGNIAEADAVARRLEGGVGLFAMIPVAIAAARRGDRELAAQALARLVEYDGDFATAPARPLEEQGLFPEVIVKLLDDLAAAGLKPAR